MTPSLVDFFSVFLKFAQKVIALAVHPAGANCVLRRVRAAAPVLLASIRQIERGSEPCLFANPPCCPVAVMGEWRCHAPLDPPGKPCGDPRKFPWRDCRNRSADSPEPTSRPQA